MVLTREFFTRWLWLCPLAGVVLAAAILAYFGLSLWSAVLAALLLVCPALIAWGAWEAWRSKARCDVPPRLEGGQHG